VRVAKVCSLYKFIQHVTVAVLATLQEDVEHSATDITRRLVRQEVEDAQGLPSEKVL